MDEAAFVPGLVTLAEGDAEEVGRLLVRCDHANLPWAPPGWKPPTWESERDWWAERLGPGERWSRGIREPDGRLIGFVSMQLSTDPALSATGSSGHISALFVHPDHWRRGLGAGLLELSETEMRRRGWTQGFLMTPDWSPARAFYATQGWLENGTRDYIEHLDLDVVELAKPVKP